MGSRLTEAQRRVLGGIAIWPDGSTVREPFGGYAPIRRLLKRRMIEVRPHPRRCGLKILVATEAGRRALTQQEGAENG